MPNQKKSYYEVLKSTSIFGGVQIVQILVQIIRSKIVAIFLGPSGLGLLSLFNSTISLVASITNLGVTTSSINSIALASSDVKQQNTDRMIAIVSNLMYYISFGGMIITLILSPILSKLTFGSYDYTIAFVWLSFSILLNQLASGKLIILQSLRKLRLLSKANLYGSISGLILSSPLFYFFGKEAIVGSILVYSLSTFIFASYFTKEFIKTASKKLSWSLLIEGKEIILSGIVLGLTGFVSTLIGYILNIFIAKNGNVNELGLYNAAISVTTSYSGIIFSAIATDYHPRLSALTSDKLVKNEVNRQAEIALYFLGPLLLFFMVFCEHLVQLLFSKEFEPAVPMIRLILIGIYFKLFSWAISFTFVARGRLRLFFWNELAANFYVLVFNILGYLIFGQIGLGLAIIISYLFYSIQVYILAKNIYSFDYNRKFILLFLSNLLVSSLLIFINTKVKSEFFLITGTIVFIGFSIYSLKQVLNIIDLRTVLGFKFLKKH